MSHSTLQHGISRVANDLSCNLANERSGNDTNSDLSIFADKIRNLISMTPKSDKSLPFAIDNNHHDIPAHID